MSKSQSSLLSCSTRYISFQAAARKGQKGQSYPGLGSRALLQAKAQTLYALRQDFFGTGSALIVPIHVSICFW